jgi:CARDB
VSTTGHCDWNSDLNQGAVTFENAIPTPASPAVCNVAPRTYTFNDRPGIIDLDVLKITDNKGFTSVPGGVSVRVTAPDLVVSEGPLPSSSAALVEKGSVSFTGKIKNQGDAATSATLNASFKIDIGNDGSDDLTLAPTPTVASVAVGAEKSVISGVWSNLPKGTHKVTLCADQPGPAVANEFFTDNNCASQVLTVLPDNRPPVAEAGISLDGVTYGASITVLRGAAVQIWLSAGADVTGDNVASFDPDGWLDAAKGVATGGKCDWNIDLVSTFVVQNTVNNPSSSALCNRNRMDKIFNDPPGTYIYPVLRITDVKGDASNIASVQVRIVGSAASLTHTGCVADACAVVAGAGANVCGTVGAACIDDGQRSGQLRPDLLISRVPRLVSGVLERSRTVTFNGRVQNRSGFAIGSPFKNAFLIDLNNNGTVDIALRSLPRIAERLGLSQLAALPFSDLTLPLPALVASLGVDEDATVISGEWRTIPEGTHRVILCADSDNEIVEFDEDNNCGSTIVQVTLPGGPGGPLRADACSVSPTETRAGQLVDWTAHATGGTGVYSYSWSGDAPLEGTTANPVTVAYQTTGSKSGSVVVTSGDETASRSCGAVTANPLQISPGQTSTLSWNTTGFTSCVITANQAGQSIGQVPVSGSRAVQPSQNTVYTLTCNGGGNPQSVTITVSSQPRTDEITPP